LRRISEPVIMGNVILNDAAGNQQRLGKR
jgi:hypothetical protein